MLQSYMEIFPIQYFLENVLVIYTKAFNLYDDMEQLIGEKRGKFV